MCFYPAEWHQEDKFEYQKTPKSFAIPLFSP